MLAAPSWSPENIKVKELQTQLLTVRTSVICAMNQLLDLKDLNTGVHSTRLAEWAVRIGRDLGLDDECLRDLEAAAILHDIGKIGVPDAILRKPSKLTEEEYAVIKKHPEYGWAVLRAVPGFERVSLFVLHHHEAFDGKGYPAGLRGDEIPIGSRIVSVMDSFDAMVSSRPYRKGLPLDEAIRRLEADIGKQFDPIVTPKFIALAHAGASTVFDATGASLASAL
jgi:HD-GYP domain-containing protein (c-di-GMP phosphodiesterase class II)